MLRQAASPFMDPLQVAETPIIFIYLLKKHSQPTVGKNSRNASKKMKVCLAFLKSQLSKSTEKKHKTLKLFERLQ